MELTLGQALPGMGFEYRYIWMRSGILIRGGYPEFRVRRNLLNTKGVLRQVWPTILVLQYKTWSEIAIATPCNLNLHAAL